MPRHKHHEQHDRVALRFTSKDTGKIHVFKNPYDHENYSFELLDALSVPVAELDPDFTVRHHLKSEVAVEQLWCRILPKCDGDCFAIGYDEVYDDLLDKTGDYDENSVFMMMGLGIQLDAPRDFGENVYMCSALKPRKDFEIQWRLELFMPERRGKRHA